MNVRTKIYLLLSILILCLVFFAVSFQLRVYYKQLLSDFEERSEQRAYVFQAEQDATEIRMVQIATVIGNSPKVEQLFLLGKHALELEGGLWRRAYRSGQSIII